MIVTRFAPSPTGYLHLGHAFAAIKAHETACKAAGRFLLRIENIDLVRSKPEFEVALLEDLRWLGLTWPEPVLRQSTRFSAYAAAIDRLESMGLLYPCFCTRREVAAEIARANEAPHGPEGPLYPGTCRHLSKADRAARIAAGAPYALRLDSRESQARLGPMNFQEFGRGLLGETGTICVDPLLFGDIVIARKDMPTSYHLSVVVDDAEQGITLVTRGNDLFAATHIQRVIQALLDLPPPTYAHHPLVLDRQGRKLSKRDDAKGLRFLREGGITPEVIWAQLGFGVDTHSHGQSIQT